MIASTLAGNSSSIARPLSDYLSRNPRCLRARAATLASPYTYAVRVAQLQVQAVADGFDPFAGIMHHTRPGFPAYAYDLIEPERPRIDAIILAFARSRPFSGADFILRKDGVCRLSPQLARMVAQTV